jgi:hypothetical protein
MAIYRTESFLSPQTERKTLRTSLSHDAILSTNRPFMSNSLLLLSMPIKFHRNLMKDAILSDHPDIVERAIPEMLEIANSPDNDAKRKVAAILCRMSFPRNNRELLLKCPRLVRTIVKMCLHGSRTDGKLCNLYWIWLVYFYLSWSVFLL